MNQLEPFYVSPRKFSARQNAALCVIPPVAAAFWKVLARTWRFEVCNEAVWQSALMANGRVIVAFWHESLALAALHYRNTGYHTLTSYSFDGELGARIVKRFGLAAVRGSSSQGGSDALRGLELALGKVAAVGFTADGPRGPRRKAKPGVAVLAARTGVPIIPHAFTAEPTWRLRSWDRFPIPKPGARVVSAYRDMIPAPADASPENIERVRLSVEEALNNLHNDIDAELKHDKQMTDHA